MYINENSPYDGNEGWCIDGLWYFDFPVGGAAFGLNTETANANPTFRIDPKAGVINFSSAMSGQSCILEYVSDGMGRLRVTVRVANERKPHSLFLFKPSLIDISILDIGL